MTPDHEFSRPLDRLPLLVSTYLWVGNESAFLVGLELKADQIRALIERSEDMEGLGPLFGSTPDDRPFLDIPQPEAWTYRYSRDPRANLEMSLGAASPSQASETRARRVLDPWLHRLDGDGDRNIHVPHPSVFAGLEETRDPDGVTLRVDQDGVRILGLGTALPVARLSPAGLLRLLCYLVEDEEVEEIVEDILARDPLEGLDFFKRGYAVLGLEAARQRPAPLPTPEQAARLLSHEDRAVRQRAIHVLEDVRGVDTDDLEPPTPAGGGRGR